MKLIIGKSNTNFCACYNHFIKKDLTILLPVQSKNEFSSLGVVLRWSLRGIFVLLFS